MKKSKTLRPLHLLILLAGCIGFANAAPFGPNGRETRWTQPNGAVLEVRVYGDEYYARTETVGGHTLVFSNNTYFYAKLSADGNSLVSTGVSADEPAPAGLELHLDIPKAEMKKIAQSRFTTHDAARLKRWNSRVTTRQKVREITKKTGAPPLGGPDAAGIVTGNKRGLTILVEFPNDPATGGSDPVSFPTDRSKIIRFCNGVGYKEDGATGSVRDYFFDQSLGLLTYTQTVTPIVTLPKPRNFYNYSDYPTNQVLNEPDLAAADLIRDAVAILQAQNFDFSSLTLNTGNEAIATNIFFAGPDSGSFAQGLWPHQFFVSPGISVGTPSKPVILSAYQITNIETAAPVIGTFCHENGHLLLDYPDIYSFYGEGVGEHCLMGSGNYLNDGKTPSPLNAYFKDIVGWGKVTEIAANAFATVDLPTTGNVAYRIPNPATPTEYFIVENRGAGDKWAEFSDDKGIAIWHVDTTTDGNFRIGPNDHYGIALEQADGRMDLENGRNRGDDGDLFDLLKPSFTDKTNPDAKWWDGSNSAVEVEVLSPLGKTTRVSLGGVPANTIIVTSPNGGEILYRDSAYTIRWKANISGNVKIDLFKGGDFLKNITPDTANTGRFDWNVAGDLKAGKNYSIRISSVTNPIPTFDFSDADFSFSNTTFPENNEFPVGWFKPGFAKTRFVVNTKDKFEGKTSLSSASPGDGKSSGVAYRSNFKAGTISFYIKVASEAGFDVAKFYIDGKAQSFPGLATAKGISGAQNWAFVQYRVSAGWHTFAWSYEKDTSYAELEDTVWIDGVTLPEGSQEIVVQQPTGKNLVNRQSLVSFPDVDKDSSSKPLTFTIKNRGKAKLSELKAIIVGKDSSEFQVRGLKKTSLKKGETTTLEVIFSPTNLGKRNAILRINSNDPENGRFDIDLEGKAEPIPILSVDQPRNTSMEDGDSRNFGIAKINTMGKTKTFTIINTGSANLKNLKIAKAGSNPGDFKIGALGVTDLDPGDSTTFKVTFSPKRQNDRSATLKILSNAKGTFKFKVTGKGAPGGGGGGGGGKATMASSSIAEAVLGDGLKSASSVLAPNTSVEVFNGSKYLALTVDKPQDGSPAGTVEVSSNLLDWYSGGKHTTIITDDARTLKVRDNTPVTQDEKRYIRLK